MWVLVIFHILPNCIYFHLPTVSTNHIVSKPSSVIPYNSGVSRNIEW